MTHKSVPAVHLVGVRKRYGDVYAVGGIDLDVSPGEVVALLGPNGAGKSTTIDMLLGLIAPDSGVPRLFGRSPREAVDAGRVGAMLQTGGLLPQLTVAEIVQLVGSLHRHPLPVAEVLGRAAIVELRDRRINQLSSGQAQRVRFAIALVPDPDLLVLDEPTVSMDVESRRAFWTAMRELTMMGRTVLFATHYLEEADAYADRIVLLRAGRIVADGTAASLKASAAGRTIRGTLPGADADLLRELPGVSAAEVRGNAVVLRSVDSDATLRTLLAITDIRDVEVTAAGLEDAFLAITADDYIPESRQ
ncbi:MAG: ABC transporter ATP-binding protein [Actinomycetes bacterium]